MSADLTSLEAWVLREARRAWNLGYSVEFLVDEQITAAHMLAMRGLIEWTGGNVFKSTPAGREVTS